MSYLITSSQSGCGRSTRFLLRAAHCWYNTVVINTKGVMHTRPYNVYSCFQWRLRNKSKWLDWLFWITTDGKQHGMKQGKLQKEKQLETLPIILALFILISFSLNARSPHKGFFFASVKRPEFHKESTIEIFKLSIIKTQQRSVNCMFNATYVFYCTL